MGMICALLSALINGSVGIVNKFGFSCCLEAQQLSFLKSAVALAVLTLVIFVSKKRRAKLRLLGQRWRQIFAVGIFGVFTLFHFETLAFRYMPAGCTAFVCIAAACIWVHILEAWLLRKKMGVLNYVSCLLLLLGLSCLSAEHGVEAVSYLGVSYAVIAGFGYALFMTLQKKFELPSNIYCLWWMFLATTIVLAGPYSFITAPVLFGASELGVIVWLAIMPTLGGFYLTAKALELLEASKVQTIEMMEPVFATVFSYFLFEERFTGLGLFGCVVIGVGIAVGHCTKKALAGETTRSEHRIFRNDRKVEV